MREPFSFDWFDIDVDLGVSFPGAYTKTDFDNHGTSGGGYDKVNNFLYANLGAQVQLGYFGATLSGEFLRYIVNSASSSANLTLTSGRYHALLAYGLANDQFVIGAGLRAASLQLSQSNSLVPTNSPSILTMTGAAPEVGLLVKPNDMPVRIGATVRAPVNGSTFGTSSATVDAQGTTRAGSLALPTEITLPWELEVGFAVQVGPRPLNPSWIDPHEQESRVRNAIADERARRERRNEEIVIAAAPEQRAVLRAELDREEEAVRKVEDERMRSEAYQLLQERKARYANWPRERILVLASLLVTGASDSAVSLEGFLDQTREPFGQRITLSPRVGIEAEPIVNLVRSRVGSYLEPSRFETGTLRQHFTFGGDVRLLPFDAFGLTKGQVWRFSVALDVAPRYVDWGIAFGAWH